MATLRLRDNFAENSWESGIAPGTKENDSKEKKYKKKKGKGGQMPGLRIEGHTPTISSTNGEACKKRPICDSTVVTKFLR